MFRPALWNRGNGCEVVHYSDPFDFMDSMLGGFWNGIADADMTRGLKTDVIDQGDSYRLEADLPGFNKEDIKVDLKDDVLTISASHSDEKDEKDKNGRYIRRERSSMNYSRSFNVQGIEPEDILAQYRNGVLSVTVPKKEAIPEKEEVKRIEVQG